MKLLNLFLLLVYLINKKNNSHVFIISELKLIWDFWFMLMYEKKQIQTLTEYGHKYYKLNGIIIRGSQKLDFLYFGINAF